MAPSEKRLYAAQAQHNLEGSEGSVESSCQGPILGTQPRGDLAIYNARGAQTLSARLFPGTRPQLSEVCSRASPPLYWASRRLGKV